MTEFVNKKDKYNKFNKQQPTVIYDHNIGKFPPSAVDLEEAVLGAVMLENTAIGEVISILLPQSFYKDANSRIYASCVELYKRNEPVNILTVVQELKKSGELEDVGGAYYVTQLTNRVASSSYIDHHALIVSQKFMMRELIRVSSELIRNAYEEQTDVFDLFDYAQKELFRITNSLIKKQVEKVSTIADKFVAQLETQEASDIEFSGLPTGLTSLDRITSGWQKSDFIIIAARPAMGKTALVLTMAYNASKDFGKSVAVFSLEMSALQLVARLFSSETEIPNSNFKRLSKVRSFADYEWQKVKETNQVLKNIPLFIDDTPGLSIFELRAKARQLKEQHKIELIIIDYLQLMTATGEKNNGNREQEIAFISRSLKILAKELEIPVIALSQLSRAVETRGGDKRPVLSDLRECLSLETSNIYTNKSFQCNVASPINLLSLHKNKLKEMQSNNVPKTKNNVFRLKTTTGRFIDCTAKHEVLTSDGYKQLQEIKLTDSIAIAINWENKKGTYIPESKFIGWMLGNGCMYGYSVPSFITKDLVISGYFCAFINERFKFSPKWHPHSKSKVYQWDITNSPDGNRTPEGNPVTRWLKENDLWGRKAKDKHIPEWFMETADEKSICELLQGLWETDGSIALGKKKETISYSTTSLMLAHQILYLTAKIGIVCYLDNGYFSDKATTLCFKLNINGSEEKRNFIKKIKLDGYKGEKLKALKLTERQSYYSNILGRDTTLNIESDLKRYSKHRFLNSLGNRRLTTTSLVGIFNKFGRGSCINEVKNKYEWLISNSIYWDKVESIEAMGEVEIFDRSVPQSNNFVVNGIIVHNSGAIEQDADIVMFIHRPEYYNVMEDGNGNSTVGIAELIVAKHRNGPTDSATQRYIAKQTKFTDIEENFTSPNLGNYSNKSLTPDLTFNPSTDSKVEYDF